MSLSHPTLGQGPSVARRGKASMKSESKPKETNVHVHRSDLDELDRVAREMFGSENVPYRTTINRLIDCYEESNNE